MQLPNLRQQYPYAVTDQGFSLRGRDFNVTVAWNVMPRVGVLYTRSKTFSGTRGGAGRVLHLRGVAKGCEAEMLNALCLHWPVGAGCVFVRGG